MVFLRPNAWLVGLSAATLLTPLALGADSDLALTCGPDFAVLDRGVGADRRLLVIPWEEQGELRVAGSVAMESDQPHRWLIVGSHVVVRSWNHLYVFRVGSDYAPTKIFSSQIDGSRGSVGGTVHVEVEGTVVRAYGLARVLEVDLAECDRTACAAHSAPLRGAPGDAVPTQSCRVKRGSLLFASSVASTQGEGTWYHDLLLMRRNVGLNNLVEGPNPFGPESILYLGTRIETVD
jgi:hypothetical protein